MSVVYTRSDSIGRKIVPAPLVTINKNYEINEEGTKRGTTYSITLTGTMVPFKGSPSGNFSNINNAFWTLGGDPPDQAIEVSDGAPFNSLLRKQEALRWLFSEDGGSLEWQPAGGQPPVKLFPKVLSINFSEGQWVNRVDYTIELEAPWILINGILPIEDDFATDLISTSTETWSFEEIDGRENEQHRVTHEVSAQGVLGFDGVGGLFENKEAWEHAKDFVDARISGIIDDDIMFAALGGTNKTFGRNTRVIRIDEDGGTYGVTEEWLLSDFTTFEEQTFTVDYIQAQDEYNVTYQGVIHGVFQGSKDGEISNINTAKIAVPSIATAKAITLGRINSFLDGKSIPDFPDKKTFAINKQDGTVTFTFQWNTSDDSTVFISEEAQISFSLDNLLNTLTFTQTVEGKGSISQRLDNAETLVASDDAALILAKSLANTTLDFFLSSVVRSFNKRTGVIRSSWTWTDRDANSEEVTIQTQQATPVLAIIPIPGRAAGPIIQDLQTIGSEIITVTVRSKRNTTEPVLDTIQHGEGGIIIGDNTTFSPQTGVAERTTRFLKDNKVI